MSQNIWVQNRVILKLQNWQSTFLKSLSLRSNKIEKMVGIIMGSQSDLPIMELAANFLKSLDIPYELTVVSAHRTPERMFD